jgi:2-polyprenyl-6-methoxyphenol hydroxylase-like FAD-dependent oxidoreductase
MQGAATGARRVRGGGRRALVVGGGIGGLSAALHLQRAGWEVSVIEQRPRLSEVDTGLSLWAFAVRRLSELGLLDRLAEIAKPMERVVHRSLSGRQLSEANVTRHSDRVGAPTYEVHRSRLQAMLADAVGHDRLIFSRRCVSCRQSGRSAVAYLADGTTEEADILIGADGVHSAVREAVVGRVELRRAEIGVWRGTLDLAHEVLPSGLHLRFVGPAGLVGLARISDEEVRWYAGARFRAGTPRSAEERKRLALGSFAGWPPLVREALERTAASDYLFNDTPHAPPFRNWGSGRITLLGDAAHCSIPTLGISAGLAIEDAAVLTECLREGSDPSSALRAYERRRRRVSARVVRTARLFGRVLMVHRRPAYSLVELGLRLAPQGPAIRWLARGGGTT